MLKRAVHNPGVAVPQMVLYELHVDPFNGLLLKDRCAQILLTQPYSISKMMVDISVCCLIRPHRQHNIPESGIWAKFQ